jgi:hypothetical protein
MPHVHKEICATGKGLQHTGGLFLYWAIIALKLHVE